MFVFQFDDGKYFRNIGKGICPCKRRFDYWTSKDFGKDFLDLQRQHLEECKTTDINDSMVFISENSIRRSNCYPWGGKIIPVRTKIEPL